MTLEERWETIRSRIVARREASLCILDSAIKNGQWADAFALEEHIWAFGAVLEDMEDLEQK